MSPEVQSALADRDATPPRLAVWEFAGLMMTYWCNARCAFCYVYSGPDRGGQLSRADALRIWSGLDALASRSGKKMRIHLAGGEPFGDWVELVALVRAARDLGLTPLEKVETNGFWATDDFVTRTRLEQLDALGMETLVVSADVYHQEFVPLERVRRCVDIARQVLGRGRVRVRWWDFLDRPVEARRLSQEERQRAFRDALERHRDRLTGRAAQRLAAFFPRHPAEHFRQQRCDEEVLNSRHVHIDPYGNVFPGVCSGIILGNALHAGVETLWSDLAQNWTRHPVVAPVVRGGSYALMEAALPLGYQPLAAGYANKCHLCTDVRQFLVERGGWEAHLGPRECYANDLDNREAAAAAPLVELTCAGDPLPPRD